MPVAEAFLSSLGNNLLLGTEKPQTGLYMEQPRGPVTVCQIM
jgi:hypothetical protein